MTIQVKYSTFRPAFVREQGAKYQVLGEQRERNEKDEFVIASARGNQKKVMKALEKQLDKAGGKFVTGDKLTLADFVLCSQMQVEFQLQSLKIIRLSWLHITPCYLYTAALAISMQADKLSHITT